MCSLYKLDNDNHSEILFHVTDVWLDILLFYSDHTGQLDFIANKSRIQKLILPQTALNACT